MKLTKKQLRNIIKESISSYILQENPYAVAGLIAAGELAYLGLGLVFAEVFNLKKNDLSDDKKIQALIDLAQQYDKNGDIKVKKIIDLHNFAQECNDIGLIKELTKYLADCKKLADIFSAGYGLLDFLSDTVSNLGADHWEKLSHSVGTPEQAWMGRPVGALLGAAIDIGQYDGKIQDIKRTIDVDKLVNMEMNIDDLHKKMKSGKLLCKPDLYGAKK